MIDTIKFRFYTNWERGEKMNNAQSCLNRIINELLGEDYYIVSSVGGNQANEIITEEIIRRFKPKHEKYKVESFRDFIDKLGGWILGD